MTRTNNSKSTPMTQRFMIWKKNKSRKYAGANDKNKRAMTLNDALGKQVTGSEVLVNDIKDNKTTVNSNNGIYLDDHIRSESIDDEQEKDELHQQEEELQPEQQRRNHCDCAHCLFDKAYEYLKPTPILRIATYLYAERKMLVCFLLHTISTLIIWFHFALMKFEEQKDNVPISATFYWWRRLVPSFEFGAMHATLFQLALLPLTMCRYTIATTLTESYVERCIPLNRMLTMHIHVGTIMVIILCISTALFFVFFGLLCANDDEAFCEKFTSEIMITGYFIFGTLLIVAITSYCRHIIPYEVFYVVHHLVFGLYAVTVAHTFDIEQRQGTNQRSQTFKWFTASILYYICDRAAMHLNHKYRVRLVSSSTIVGNNGSSKMIILKLRRPPLFRFRPGQYAYLKLSGIDNHFWHPFSIASDPASDVLEFYIEVCDSNYNTAGKRHSSKSQSWTVKLWKILENCEDNNNGNANNNGISSNATMNSPSSGIHHRQFDMEIMGPYGTSLGNAKNYSHALAIGTGTGIVPIMSMFKQHVRRLLLLNPDTYHRDLAEYQRKLLEVEVAEEAMHGSVFQRICTLVTQCTCGRDSSYITLRNDQETKSDAIRQSIQSCLNKHEELTTTGSSWSKSSLLSGSQDNSERMHHNDVCHTHAHEKQVVRSPYVQRRLRMNMREMKTAALQATRSIYGVVGIALLPVMGVAMIGLTVSFNTIGITPLYYNMIRILRYGTFLFQTCFGFAALFIWDANSVLAYLDTVTCFLVCPFIDWFWLSVRYHTHGILSATDIAVYTILIGYMTIRSWSKVVKPRHCSWRSAAQDDFALGRSSATGLEKLEIVWVARSASLVSEIIPDINAIWESLIKQWGEAGTAGVCQVSVYITEKDEDQVLLLHSTLRDTQLYRSGCIRFGRPNFAEIMEDHTVNMISTRRSSHSLLAYVGSVKVASEIHQDKITNEMVTTITGNKKHQMEFVSETSYGGGGANFLSTPRSDKNDGNEREIIVKSGHYDDNGNANKSESMRKVFTFDERTMVYA